MDSILNLESALDPKKPTSPTSLYTVCPAFSPGNFSDPRPPEKKDDIHTKCFATQDSALFDDPSSTSLLLQMFMSELQDVPEERRDLDVGVVITPTPSPTPSPSHDLVVPIEKDGDSDSFARVPQSSTTSSEAPSPKTPSVVLADHLPLHTCSSPSLERTLSTNGFNDPLDNPFFSEFMDVSLLQGTCFSPTCGVLLEEPAQTTTTTVGATDTLSLSCVSPVPSSNSSVFDSNVDVTVVNSSVNVNTELVEQDQASYDLSECVELLSSTTPSPSPPSVNSIIDNDQIHNTTNVTTQPSQYTVQDSLENFDFSGITDDTLTLACAMSYPLGNELTNDVILTPAEEQFCNESDTHADNTRKQRSRKRKVSIFEDDESSPTELPPAEKKKNATKDSHQKYIERRDKNNKASKVSRAKRRQRCVGMFERVTELETLNAQLITQVEEMTAETERLKKLLIQRLSQ